MLTFPLIAAAFVLCANYTATFIFTYPLFLPIATNSVIRKLVATFVQDK